MGRILIRLGFKRSRFEIVNFVGHRYQRLDRDFGVSSVERSSKSDISDIPDRPDFGVSSVERW